MKKRETVLICLSTVLLTKGKSLIKSGCRPSSKKN